MATVSSFFLNTLEPLNAKWELEELIGEGAYGEVYRGIDKKRNYAAIKVIENSPNKLDEIQIETSVFQRFSKHPNLVGYFGTYLNSNEQGLPKQIWIVMEYCQGRSAAELAKTVVQNGQRLSENVIKYIIHQTLNAIRFLHQNHVIHRDIKGPNVLMTIKGHVKLIDYGVSANVPSTMARRHSSVGSPFWMAPEVIACEQQLDYNYDNRCDVWSLGITAIELADGDPPLAEEHPMRALFKIPRNPPPTIRNRVGVNWSEGFHNFIARAVTKDFETRPTADQILSDPFLEKCSDEDTLLLLRKELMSLIHVIIKQYDSSSGGDVGARTLKAKQENAKKNMKMLEVDDLASLPKLTEDTILTYIMERYAADQIYTYIGEILLAVNPFKELKIYGDGASLLYQDTQKSLLPPHIFMIACTTYQAMIHKQHDQCCVISGESGSGKTVSANFLISQLASIGIIDGSVGMNKKLVDKILQVNPLIEAFGNAQTVINHNSSRFGKFLELHFTHSGALVGAQLTEYLLEKSRVVSQPTGERNFHILYYMIAGLDFHKKLDEFELSTTSKHQYLNTDELSLAESACTSEMQMRFTKVQQCFENLGFTREEIQSLYCLLAAVIHLGDVDFMVDIVTQYEDEKAKVTNMSTLDTVASLLCVESNELNESLTTYSSVTRGETITRNNNVEKAMDCRDATAKALYGRIFSWIVKRINTCLRAEDKTQSLHKKIGILDIFGFENFTSNSFEQLCINIANEQLQFFFNEHVFVWEYEEYLTEDIKGVKIEFKNNKDILDLFLQKPVGILALLDEESRFPKASDLTLVEKFEDNIQSEYLRTSKETSTYFTVFHYAGKVIYDATGFLEKNRDTLSADVIQVLQESTDDTVSALFHSPTGGSNQAPKQEKSAKFGRNTKDSQMSSVATNRFQQTVSSAFRQSLRSLLSKVIKADPHFVRCIRPNVQNSSNLFDQEAVSSQLKCTGVFETTKIRRQGYSDRIPFKEFVHRYKFLMYEQTEIVPDSPELCVKLLRVAQIDEDESWKIGKTKVFLKYWHAERLANCFERYRAKVLLCQKAVRLWMMKYRITKHKNYRYNCATKIRAQWLAFDGRRKYIKLRDEHRRRAGAPESTFDDSLRPFYRNMKRERVGYDDYEEFYDSDEEESVILKRKLGEPSHANDENDHDGQAALEETRAIILLSQIDLASKEAFEMLDRTSYPIIHSVRAKAIDAGVVRTKNQKLNHKERVIAVVDGYGDPLQPKFRSAKYHFAEVKKPTEEVVKSPFSNAPMLGLGERPVREGNAPLGDIVEAKKSTPKRKKKITPKKSPKKQQPPPKKVVQPTPKVVENEEYYPSRMANHNVPRRDGDWFYPTGLNHKVLQEKQLIENRMRDVKRTEQKKSRLQEHQQPKYVRAGNYETYAAYDKKSNDYQPYNYLLNNQTEQSKLIGHNINQSPAHNRRYIPANGYNAPQNRWNQYPVSDETLAIQRSPQRNPPPRPKARVPTPVREIAKPPVVQPTALGRSKTSNYNNRDYIAPDPFDYLNDIPKKRRQYGFNYGLQQQSVLNDLKLKKTGRLQQLLVK